MSTHVQFGVYLPATPGELSRTGHLATVVAVSPENFLRALTTRPHVLIDTVTRLMAVLSRRQHSDDLADDLAHEQAKALYTGCLARCVASNNRADITASAAKAYQLEHRIPKNDPTFAAQTSRLLARQLAGQGNFADARLIFEQAVKEESASEKLPGQAAYYSDPLELAILRLCLTSDEQKLDPPAKATIQNKQIEVINAVLDKALNQSAEVQFQIATDLLWLSFQYARYPVIHPDPLNLICKCALGILSSENEGAGEVEAYRVLGAMAIERGDYTTAADLFYMASTLPTVQNDPMAAREFLHSAGLAVCHGGAAELEGGAEVLEINTDEALKDGDIAIAILYRLDLAEVYIKSWQLNRAKTQLDLILPEQIDSAGDHANSRYLATLARMDTLHGELLAAELKIEEALNHCARLEDSSKNPAEAQHQNPAQKQGNSILERLNRQRDIERLPVKVLQFETLLLETEQSNDTLLTLSTSAKQLINELKTELALNHSPWTAELLLRAYLGEMRLQRRHADWTPQTQLTEAMDGPKSLIIRFPKLLNSVYLAELFLERGLRLMKLKDDVDAVEALSGCIEVATKFADLGFGPRWAAHQMLARMGHKEQDHAKAASGILGRIVARSQNLGSPSAKEYLDRRHG